MTVEETAAWIENQVVAAGDWVGERFSELLSEENKKKLGLSTDEAMKTGENQSWASHDGTKGNVLVTSTQSKKGNVTVKALKGRLKQVPPLEIIGLPYMAMKNANVRGGPGTDFVIVDGIKKGDTVKVIGKVIDANWYLIGEGELASGFVYSTLLSESSSENMTVSTASQDGKSTQVAGEVEKQTVAIEQTCRSIQQKITLADGSIHEEEITACKSPKGWIVQ